MRTRRWSEIFLVAFAIMSLSCTNNTTLDSFDLGEGRQIRVTTGWSDELLPLYYEMYEQGTQIQRCFILQEEPSREALSRLEFQVLSDQSKTAFVLIRTAPERTPLAFFDYKSNFRFPCCSNDNGAECINKRNELAERLERDNAGLSIERLRLP